MTATELLGLWRSDAEVLRNRGCTDAARLLAACADELDRVLCASEDELVTLADAATLSGYTPAHLRALIAEGTLRDRAASGPKRLRRGDLPRKPGYTTPRTRGAAG